jgi:hypothetical protein
MWLYGNARAKKRSLRLLQLFRLQKGMQESLDKGRRIIKTDKKDAW